LRTGQPGKTYPWHWSVLPWFEGTAADLAPPAASQAVCLAEFLLALHQPAPPDAPLNDVRGVPIANRSKQVSERLTRLRDKTALVTPEVTRVWEAGLAAPRSTAMMWLHGDLHSQNVLVERDTGKITAIIDWGDITSGDNATDLAAVWLLFEDRSARERALQIYGPDQATLDRAKAWAVLFAAVLLDSGLINNPRHAAIGRQAFQRISEDG
jgi:aminoglycoside phosphotransferase (APT) family kinase protein